MMPQKTTNQIEIAGVKEAVLFGELNIRTDIITKNTIIKNDETLLNQNILLADDIISSKPKEIKIIPHQILLIEANKAI